MLQARINIDHRAHLILINELSKQLVYPTESRCTPGLVIDSREQAEARLQAIGFEEFEGGRWGKGSFFLEFDGLTLNLKDAGYFSFRLPDSLRASYDCGYGHTPFQAHEVVACMEAIGWRVVQRYGDECEATAYIDGRKIRLLAWNVGGEARTSVHVDTPVTMADADFGGEPYENLMECCRLQGVVFTEVYEEHGSYFFDFNGRDKGQQVAGVAGLANSGYMFAGYCPDGYAQFDKIFPNAA